MLTNADLRRVGAANIQALWDDRARRTAQMIAVGSVGLLLTVGTVAAALHPAGSQATGVFGFGRVAVAPANVAVSDDVAPSPLREEIARQRAAGHRPNEALAVLEEQSQQQALQLQQQQELNAKQAQELDQLHQTLSDLHQSMASDQETLTSLAKQLGLPQDKLAPASPLPASAIGGFSGIDQAALPAAPAPDSAGGAFVKTARDLQQLVSSYLSLPCPLPAGDPRCDQAVDHARSELWRGHGLDADKPDATPILNITEVAQGFGPTAVTLEPLQEVDGQMVHFHDGVDLPADEGEPVMAAASGTVVFADALPSGALTVEIAHASGLHTLYLHESQLLVKVGDHVQKGQIIGLVGTTGMSTGPHVHFTVQDASGKAIDPTPFIGPLPPVDNFAADMWTPAPAPVYIAPAPRYVAPVRAPVRTVAPVRAAAPVKRR